MRIFVAKLNFVTTSDALRELFEAFGEVDSAQVIMDEATGRSRGFGFVEMPNDDEAQAAIDALNESDFDGNTIIVKRTEISEGRRPPSGGGEYGPKWHLAAIKDKKQNTYDDFQAIAEDLIARKITSPAHLGIEGGSAGGLLVGVAFTQRPDLYKAVVCAVPLLDMKRYNKLLAGASWMDENGGPDKPEDWAYLQKYSPYRNVKTGMSYPEVFFTTSTRDDRVHPGHARKMAAKMNDMGYKNYYYENTEGGHAGASTNEQRATLTALVYSYLWMKLK